MLSWNKFLGLGKRTRKFQSGRGLRIESLEGRQLLAGDVAVEFVASGDLLVTGDEYANDIVVASSDNGVIVIGNDETNIVFNGESAEFHQIDLPEGMTSIRDLKIDMLDGDDSVLLEDLTVGRSMRALLRDGDDWMGVENTTVLRNASISNGPGTDFVGFDYASVSERLSVNAGAGAFEMDANQLQLSRLNINAAEGDDTINISYSEISGDFVSGNTGGDDDVTITNMEIEGSFHSTGGDALENVYLGVSSIDGDVTFETGDGDANVTIYAASVSGNVNITNGGGNNSTYIGDYSYVSGDVNVTGSNGSDSVQIAYSSYVEGDLNVLTGAGDDSIDIDNAGINGNWNIDTAAGDDSVMVDYVYASSIHLDTGVGHDLVNFYELHEVEDVSVFTSAGDDYVNFQYVETETLWIDLGTATLNRRQLEDFSKEPGGEILNIGYSSIDTSTDIRGSVGSRSIDLHDSNLGDLVIRTSAGEDYISLQNISAGESTIRTGSSHDFVQLGGESHFSNFEMFLGSGSDVFATSYEFVFSNPARLHGGSGPDEAHFAEHFGEYTPIIESFEFENFMNEPTAS